MRVVFFIHTSGQGYLWSTVAHTLKEKGHELMLIAREEANICQILDEREESYDVYGRASKSKYGKIIGLPKHLSKGLRLVMNFRPDVIVGTGPIETWAGKLLGKRCIIFDDCEPTPTLERLSWRYLADVILTPACFLKDLGRKHVRFNGYKELAYLHPNHFSADNSIYKELNIGDKEKFLILRFGAFEAVHDASRKGFSLADKHQLVQQLTKYARVFISSEGSLPVDLQSYKLPISHHRIHHALYYAEMLVSDTGTMAWEAAVLGTPAVVCASFIQEFGNFIELENNYDLIYCFQESNKAVQKAIELIQQPDLKEKWAKKCQRLLDDKIDVTQFIVDFIENYPESFSKYKQGKNQKLVPQKQ